jgi:hypothetical protein
MIGCWCGCRKLSASDMAGGGKEGPVDGLVIVVQPLGDGWHATVWEGCYSLYAQARFTSFASAIAAASAWVRLHRPGMSYRVEMQFVAGGMVS